LPLDPQTRDALGPPVLRLQSTASDWHPRFSPDGRQFAFTSWRGGGADIWVADVDGRNPRQLSKLGATDPGAPRWAPDGTLLSFWRLRRTTSRIPTSLTPTRVCRRS